MTKYKHRTAADITFTTDATGRRIAHVGLSGTKERAKLLAEDLDRIVAAGYSLLWSFTATGRNRRYVLLQAINPKGRKRTLTVARLITKAGRGQIVKYLDGDRLNLLPENLLVAEGISWTPADRVEPCKVSHDRAEEDAQAPTAATGRLKGNPLQRVKPGRPPHRVRHQSKVTAKTEATSADVLPKISETVSK
ncbi:MAG: hypothetical protein ACTHMK_11265 [Dyella sp.]|uniref:hypothetical protein n=1 Tax=Dyella sp. TaxID=1869338 RepID=UPI003F7F571F